jgi:WD40 repeat protein
VDLSTGELVFDWSSADHIDFAESYQKYSKDAPYDPVHLNSIDITPDGKLLVSARNTWTVYKVDPSTGEIIWRLGGKKTDFSLGPGVSFAWQHDARTHTDGTISLFDDQAAPPEAKQSRGLVLNVDETAKTAAVGREYFHPTKTLLAGSQGSFQVLPGGDVLIGWGAEPYYTELQPDGTLVLDGKFAAGSSYRAFRFEWTGTPTDLPALAVDRTPSGRLLAYASWNGSTETVRWRVLTGAAADRLTNTAEAARDGFETRIVLPRGAGRASRVAVAALDANGTVLARSRTIAV